MFTNLIAQYHPTGVKFCTLELPVGSKYLSENGWYKKKAHPANKNWGKQIQLGVQHILCNSKHIVTECAQM